MSGLAQNLGMEEILELECGESESKRSSKGGSVGFVSMVECVCVTSSEMTEIGPA